MHVYLFSDYLKTIHGDPMQESQAICEIEPIKSMPECMVQVKGKLASVCMLGEDNIYIKYMDGIPKQEEVYFSKEITCPHCGAEESDSWEASEGDDAHECCTCRSIFSYERNVEVTYSSKIVERNDNVLTLV